ncbi:unnamed protein product [Absidia cylindrospora]
MSFSVALPHEALKAFGYGLDALNKFGDEVNIDAKREQLILWAVNSSITGQVVLRMSPKLFEKYTIKPSAETGSTTTSCRLLLKQPTSISSIKQCELKLNGGPATSRTSGGVNGPEHRLYLKFVYENGMTKTNSLWYTDTDISRPLFSKNLPYSFIIDPGVFSDCIALMDNRIQDISFLFTPSRVIIKTFWDPSIGNNTNKPMQSQFKIPRQDFTYYNVTTELVLTFSMKEFKTAVNYGTDTCDMLHAQFEEPGKPLIFTVEQRGFVIADFALMTFTSNEGITQASGLTMNNNSITTENSMLSISKNSMADLQQDQRPGPSSTSREHRYSSPTPSTSTSRREQSVAPQSNRSPSIEMLPPSFDQQKRTTKRNSPDNSNDPLFPFGSPSAPSRIEPQSSTPHQRQSSQQQHHHHHQHQQHHNHHHQQHEQPTTTTTTTTTHQVSTSDNDATTDEEEELFLVDPNQPKAKRRFFSD